jgi:putative transposase
MPHESYTRVYVHLVWATWDRLPLITEVIRDDLYHIMLAKCQALGAKPLALGGVEDHVHLLVRLPAMVALARLVGEIKGASAHAVNGRDPLHAFKWQGSYGAFSVAEGDIARVQHYIRHQAEHHHDLTVCDEWRLMEQSASDADNG